MGQAGGGLIDPAQFPCRARYLDLEAIRDSAGVLRTYAGNLTGHMDTIAANWNGLALHYVAPESWRVLNVMGPAQNDANTVADVYEGIAGKLETYADELEFIKPRLADLEQRAWDFRNEVKDGVQTSIVGEVDTWVKVVSPVALILDATTQGTATVAWYEHGPTVAKNEDLLREYSLLLEQISMSASSAANAIRRCHDFTSGILTPDPYGGAASEQIMASANPWGKPVAEERSVLEQITDGFGDFGGGLLFGITSMVGYHPDTGWSPDTFTGTWTGIANMAQVAASVASNPANAVFVIAAAGQTFNVPGSHALPSTSIDGRIDYAEKMGPVWSGLVGYDQGAQDGWHQWKDEPYRMGTGVLLNVGSCFVPTAGGAGIAAKTAAGARAANVAVHTADVLVPFGGQAVRGGLGVWRSGVNLIKGENVTGGVIRAGAEGVTHAGLGAVNKPTGLPEGVLSPKNFHDYPIHYGPSGPPSRSINIDHLYPNTPKPSSIDNPVGVGHGTTPEVSRHATPNGAGTPSPNDPRSLLWRDQPARTVEPSATARETGAEVTAPERVATPEPEPATIGAKPGHITAEHSNTATNNTTGTPPTPGGSNTTGGSTRSNGTTTTGSSGSGSGTPTDRTPEHGNGSDSGPRGGAHHSGDGAEPSGHDTAENHGQEPHDPSDQADDSTATTGTPPPKTPITQAEYDIYVAKLGTRGASYGSPAAQHFQHQVTGRTIEYKLTGGGEEIWGDGLTYDPKTGGVVLEAKYVDRPGRSIYEGNAPDFILEKPMRDFKDEVERYAKVITDSRNPLTRLEVVVSTPAAQVFVSSKMMQFAAEIQTKFGLVLNYIVRVGP